MASTIEHYYADNHTAVLTRAFGKTPTGIEWEYDHCTDKLQFKTETCLGCALPDYMSLDQAVRVLAYDMERYTAKTVEVENIVVRFKPHDTLVSWDGWDADCPVKFTVKLFGITLKASRGANAWFLDDNNFKFSGSILEMQNLLRELNELALNEDRFWTWMIHGPLKTVLLAAAKLEDRALTTREVLYF